MEFDCESENAETKTEQGLFSYCLVKLDKKFLQEIAVLVTLKSRNGYWKYQETLVVKVSSKVNYPQIVELDLQNLEYHLLIPTNSPIEFKYKNKKILNSLYD